MTDKEFENKFIVKTLAAHNNYRKIHGVPPLILNQELSKIASKRAKKLIKTNEINHYLLKYNGSPLGENLYVSFKEYSRIEGNKPKSY